MGEEPASENETKALIRIMQEYGGRGLLTFGQAGREIVYYHSEQGMGRVCPRSYRLADICRNPRPIIWNGNQAHSLPGRNSKGWEPRNNIIFRQ